jgi:hypothetical protein
MLKKIILTTSLATISVFALFALDSCRKSNCYDAEMAQNHSGFCTLDCPGVTACNGKFYCNTCEANKAGYNVSE